MSSFTTTVLFLTVFFVLLPTETYAFGAGDIPDFSYLNDKAFRHGDIENVLEELVKSAGGIAASGNVLEFAHSLVQQAVGGSKFSRSDIKKVYFGNWLRDYSQAMDIAGLSKLTSDTLILIVSVLGFMTFGFATEEFEVTADRLGVYLPVEHIDNPKGYAEKEGDARRFHPKLRPPVDPRELEIDQRTGMKNYMATENRGWDTSTAFIRRTFKACIEHGRRARGREGADLWEAYRLLGTGLHTMEDLLAHSNWCEVGLRKMGYKDVFCHVGDRVIINTPSGPAPPLVTGTFGGADFIHSLMGEATDHLSQASVTDLSNKFSESNASSASSSIEQIKNILHKLPFGNSDSKMSQADSMAAASQAYSFDPSNIAPPEVQRRLLELLVWHDSIFRDFIKAIESIPGLGDLMEELTNALNAYVYTLLAPYIAPLLSNATGVLGEGSKAVIDSEDQFEVFENPNASDPTHSFLSKDHFALILNEPAGKIAQLVVKYAVNLIVPAWGSNEDPDRVIDQILEAFHHPYYNDGRSRIQHDMYEELGRWFGGLGPEGGREIIGLLTKESVKNGKNKRPGSENQTLDEPGYGHSHSHGPTYGAEVAGAYAGKKTQSSYGQGQSQSQYGSTGGRRNDDNENRYGSSGRQEQQSSGYGGGGAASSFYGAAGGRKDDNQYGGGKKKHDDDNQYGSSGYGGGRQEQSSGYGGGRQEHSSAYGGGASYGQSQSQYGGGRQEHESSGYGGGRKKDDDDKQYGSSGYGGGKKKHDDDDNQYGSSGYGGGRKKHDDDDNQYGSSGYGGGKKKHDDDSQYGSSGYGGGRQEQTSAYGGGRQEHSSGYGGGQSQTSYGGSAYGQSQSQYGRQEHESSGYGGGRKKDDDDNQYGSSGYGGGKKKHDDDDNQYGSSGYGGGKKKHDDDNQYGSSGYGGGGRKKDDDDNENKYGGGRKKHEDDNQYGSSGYGGGGYGGGRRQDKNDSDSDDEKKRRRQQQQQQQSSGYGGGSSGYNPSYTAPSNTYGSSGGYGGSQGYGGGSSGYGGGSSDTFGAERMKIRDDDSDEEKRRKKYGQGGRKKDDSDDDDNRRGHGRRKNDWD